MPHQSARHWGAAEDYFNDKCWDTDLLYTGVRELPKDFWDKHGKDIPNHGRSTRPHAHHQGPMVDAFTSTSFVFQDDDKQDYATIAAQGGRNGATHAQDYTHQKNSVWGVLARNREQNFAPQCADGPELDFVTPLGQAGPARHCSRWPSTFTQTLETKLYTEIIITRVTVPLGEDIGFLPGNRRGKK